MISVSAVGYSSGSRNVAIRSGDTVTIDLTLTSLSEHGSISGTITDFSTDIPIEGVTVVVKPGGFSAKSLAGGDFILSDLVAGTYSLSAFKSGYSTDIVNGVVVSQGETKGVDFKLSSLGTGYIEGVITDALSGEDIKGVKVRLDPGIFLTTTDFGGRYCIDGIVTGAYTIHVSQGGYLPYTKADVRVFGNERVTLNIELQPCPFGVLGLSHKDLVKSRRLRDEILLQSPLGKKLVSLFYEYTPEISGYIFSDPALKAELLDLLEILLSKMEYYLATRRFVLPANLIMKIEECIKRFYQKDNPKTNSDVHQLIEILHDGETLKQFGIILENQKPH